MRNVRRRKRAQSDAIVYTAFLAYAKPSARVRCILATSSLFLLRSEDTVFTRCVYLYFLCCLSFLFIPGSGGSSNCGRAQPDGTARESRRKRRALGLLASRRQASGLGLGLGFRRSLRLRLRLPSLGAQREQPMGEKTRVFDGVVRKRVPSNCLIRE